LIGEGKKNEKPKEGKATMVLYVIGLGLGDEQDITLRGLNAVKKCKKVFLENYTSVLGMDHNKLVRRTLCK
jgi:diphthamide biosynthesis methyltransferase